MEGEAGAVMPGSTTAQVGPPADATKEESPKKPKSRRIQNRISQTSRKEKADKLDYPVGAEMMEPGSYTLPAERCFPLLAYLSDIHAPSEYSIDHPPPDHLDVKLSGELTKEALESSEKVRSHFSNTPCSKPHPPWDGPLLHSSLPPCPDLAPLESPLPSTSRGAQYRPQMGQGTGREERAALVRAWTVPRRSESERSRLSEADRKAKYNNRVRETIRAYRAAQHHLRVAIRNRQSFHRENKIMWHKEMTRYKQTALIALERQRTADTQAMTQFKKAKQKRQADREQRQKQREEQQEAEREAQRAAAEEDRRRRLENLGHQPPSVILMQVREEVGPLPGAQKKCGHIEHVWVEGTYLTLPCTEPSLPFSQRCTKHILHDPHQRLFVQCQYRAPSLNNTQCINPVGVFSGTQLCVCHSK